MSEVCKGKLEICANDSFNKLDDLINIQKMKKEKAFKKVADEWNSAHPDSFVNWESLKKAYNRAIKPVVKSVTISRKSTIENPGQCPEKLLVPLDVPMINSTTECTVDTTKYVPIELYTEAQKRIEQLQKTIEDMLPIVDKAMQFELKETVIDSAPEKSTLLPREIIFDFIKQKGNSIQCHALKSDDLTNEKLYSIFVKVREDYKASTPPPAWDTSVTTATGIL